MQGRGTKTHVKMKIEYFGFFISGFFFQISICRLKVSLVYMLVLTSVHNKDR